MKRVKMQCLRLEQLLDIQSERGSSCERDADDLETMRNGEKSSTRGHCDGFLVIVRDGLGRLNLYPGNG